MKVLVTGSTSPLGKEMLCALQAADVEALALPEEVDFLSQESVFQAIFPLHPDAIIHCAGYEQKEKAEHEPEVCIEQNALSTLHVARSALRLKAKMMIFSDATVFSGEGTEPIAVRSPYAPHTIYGLSKVQAETAVRDTMTRYFILRTHWLYGQGDNEITTRLLQSVYSRTDLTLPAEPWGSPTYIPDLARLACQMIQTEKFGIYHATNEGYCTPAEFGAAFMRLFPSPCHIIPVHSTQPGNLRLSKQCLDDAGFPRLPDWEVSLQRYIFTVAP